MNDDKFLSKAGLLHLMQQIGGLFVRQSDFSSHKTDTIIHTTATDKEQLLSAYAHSKEPHVSIPTDGLAGEILAKKDNTGNETEWVNAPREFDATYDEESEFIIFQSKSQIPGNASIDKALIVDGDAADAKVTGDKINELKVMLKNTIFPSLSGANGDGLSDDSSFFTPSPSKKVFALDKVTIQEVFKNKYYLNGYDYIKWKDWKDLNKTKGDTAPYIPMNKLNDELFCCTKIPCEGFPRSESLRYRTTCAIIGDLPQPGMKCHPKGIGAIYFNAEKETEGIPDRFTLCVGKLKSLVLTKSNAQWIIHAENVPIARLYNETWDNDDSIPVENTHVYNDHTEYVLTKDEFDGKVLHFWNDSKKTQDFDSSDILAVITMCNVWIKEPEYEDRFISVVATDYYVDNKYYAQANIGRFKYVKSISALNVAHTIKDEYYDCFIKSYNDILDLYNTSFNYDNIAKVKNEYFNNNNNQLTDNIYTLYNKGNSFDLTYRQGGLEKRIKFDNRLKIPYNESYMVEKKMLLYSIPYKKAYNNNNTKSVTKINITCCSGSSMTTYYSEYIVSIISHQSTQSRKAEIQTVYSSLPNDVKILSVYEDIDNDVYKVYLVGAKNINYSVLSISIDELLYGNSSDKIIIPSEINYPYDGQYSPNEHDKSLWKILPETEKEIASNIQLI